MADEIDFSASAHAKVKRLPGLGTKEGAYAAVVYGPPKDSMMDTGLLATLTKAELQDLLAAHPPLSITAYKQLMEGVRKARKKALLPLADLEALDLDDLLPLQATGPFPDAPPPVDLHGQLEAPFPDAPPPVDLHGLLEAPVPDAPPPVDLHGPLEAPVPHAPPLLDLHGPLEAPVPDAPPPLDLHGLLEAPVPDAPPPLDLHGPLDAPVPDGPLEATDIVHATEHIDAWVVPAVVNLPPNQQKETDEPFGLRRGGFLSYNLGMCRLMSAMLNNDEKVHVNMVTGRAVAHEEASMDNHFTGLPH